MRVLAHPEESYLRAEKGVQTKKGPKMLGEARPVHSAAQVSWARSSDGLHDAAELFDALAR